MENEVSNKIRLLLNELAILNQPDVVEGKFIYQLDTLKRLKTLCAELYLLSDVVYTPGSIAQSTIVPPAISNPVTVAQVIHPEEKISILPDVVSEKIEIVNPIVESVPELELIPEPVKSPEPLIPEEVRIPEPEKVIESKIELNSNNNGTVIAGKISLTRRFEYINNLFSGDAAAFASFLGKFADAGYNENGLNLFEKEAETRNWKRKSESASELKLLLKKLI